MDRVTRAWLRDKNSLTRRLIDRCGRDFSVFVINQRWTKPRIEEARLLKIHPRQRVLLRQVQLRCGREVLVYARSVIPLATLRGKHRRLKSLGNKPLGAYLFAHHQLKREIHQLARIKANDPLYHAAFDAGEGGPDGIWGRRSLFSIDGKKLLVSEFFLPGITRE